MDTIKGAGGGGKAGGGGRESDDTLFSDAFVEIIEIVSMGQCKGLVDGGKSIYMNDTPILADDGARNSHVQWASRTGWQNQSPFEAVDSVSTETSINAKVEHTTPVINTISNPDADYAVVTLGFPRLMVADDKGNINPTKVEFKIECQPFGGSYALVSRSSKLLRGAYDATNHYHHSPASTYFAEIYIASSSPLDVTVEHSTDGTTFSSLEIVPLTEARRFWYSASIRVELTEGEHYFRWGNDSESFYALYNFVNWTHFDAAGTVTVKGKTGSRYQKQFRFPLEGDAPWSIKVTRVTADAADSKTANDLYWDSLRTEIVARLNYPNMALMYYKIPADEFSSIPRRRVLWDGLQVRVPVNYDPLTRVYSGVWNGSFKTAWSNNPAWCFYNLCTNARHGVGKFITAAMIDKWALYSIAQYCDELVDSGKRDSEGGIIYEPRFTCNMQIFDAKSAYDWLNAMVSIFRGMMYVINGQLTAVCDMPQEPVALFTPANVIDGQFTFSGTGALARKTVAWVKWNDPDDLYNEKYEYVPDNDGIKRYGLSDPKDVTAVGCTSLGQAHRAGKYALLDGEICTWGVAHDAAFLKPGDIVSCMIPLRSNATRFGGRILAIDSVTVTLDSPVHLVLSHDYQLSVMLADGTVGSRALVVAETETTSTVIIASEFGDVVDYAVWVLVDLDGIQPTQWRILGLTNEDGIKRQITAVSHNPDKYDYLDNFDSAINDSVLPSINPMLINAPASVTIENLPFIDKNGVAQNKLHVSWAQVTQAVRYQVRWRLNSGNWSRMANVTGTLFELIIKDDGDYQFEVRAVNLIGKVSAAVSAVETINGDATEIVFDAQWDEL